MKQRFKARELWLFVPFLLIGVAALLYWRWEQITPPNQRGMYVVKIERTTATAREEADHFSHHVTVTLAHRWPRPRWWGQAVPAPYLLDPLNPTQAPTMYYNYMSQSNQSFASGGRAIRVQGGKEVVSENPATVSPGIITFDGTNYKIEHHVNLRGAHQGTGDIIFKGLYRFKNTELIAAQKVVRAKGEQFPPVDKNPGLRLVAIKVSPWKKRIELQMNNTMGKSDILLVKLIVEYTPPLAAGAAKPEFKGQVYSVEDEGRSNFSHMDGFSLHNDVPASELRPNQSGKSFYYWLDEKEKVEGRLIVKGEVWMDDRWPLPFEIKLPPQPPATAPAK